MAESAAASLASNILDFIDFAVRLFTSTPTVYSFTSDGIPDIYTVDDYTLDVITRDIQYHCDKLDHSDLHSDTLNTISKESRQLADELQAGAQKIREKAGGPDWSSFTAALHDVMEGNEAAALVKKLSKVNESITAHLLESMVTQQEQLTIKFDGMTIEIKGQEVHIGTFLEMVLDDIKKAAVAARKRGAEINEKLEHCLEALDKGTVDTSESPIGVFPSDRVSSRADTQSNSIAFYALQSDRETLISHYQAMKVLEFNEMQSSEEHIKVAHAGTFRWILDDSRNDIGFTQWLEKGNTMYWIRGKPGAGKSTLMKYICDQSKTFTHLERWAHGNPLITASFFPRFAGNDMQKSVEGLLRSLLIDIFAKHPLLIQDTRLLESNSFGHALRRGSCNSQMLMSLLQKLVEETPTTKYCFFIDGLDELVDPHAELFTLIDSLAEHANVKFCVSSRPLPQFDNRYDSGENRLQLEDFIQKDIESFMTHKLEANAVSQSTLGDSQYQGLITRVADKSEGGFLWAVLVIRSLIEGLNSGDSIEVLESRLAEFPPDLTSFLAYTLSSVDEKYRQQTAEAFRVALVYEGAVPLTLFSALFEMQGDIERPMLLKCKPHSRAEILELNQDTHQQLDVRCKGLLEVTGIAPASNRDPIFTVRWLHRCVSDFFKDSDDMERILGVDLKNGPNIRLLLCGAFLGVAKWLPSQEDDLTLSNPFDEIAFRPFCAMADKLYKREPDSLGVRPTEMDVQMLYIIILELELTLQKRWPTNYTKLVYKALELDWSGYIDYRMKMGSPTLASLKSRLLDHMLGFRDSVLNPDIMEILLDHGANPNEQLRPGAVQTPWTTVLSRYLWEKAENRKKPEDRKRRADGRKRPEKYDVDRTVRAVKLLAAYGADPDVRVTFYNWSAAKVRTETRTAKELVDNLTDHPELRDVRFKMTEIVPNSQSSSWLSSWLDRLRSCTDWVIGIKLGHAH